MNWSVMNVVCFQMWSAMNVVCYERGLLWTGLLWTGLLWTWPVMNVVCYERVCYEQVCYEGGLLWLVLYERVCFEREPSQEHTLGCILGKSKVIIMVGWVWWRNQMAPLFCLASGPPTLNPPLVTPQSQNVHSYHKNGLVRSHQSLGR